MITLSIDGKELSSGVRGVAAVGTTAFVAAPAAAAWKHEVAAVAQWQILLLLFIVSMMIMQLILKVFHRRASLCVMRMQTQDPNLTTDDGARIRAFCVPHS